jgi:heme/copper-type cytochrome/quinol oxidase subunit 2
MRISDAWSFNLKGLSMRSGKTLSLCLAAFLITGAVQAKDAPLLRLEIKDGLVSPQRLEVPAGKAFRLEIRNTGKVAAEFECKPLNKEKVVVAGATTVISFNAATAGDYTFVDEFHENLATGQGVIVVK